MAVLTKQQLEQNRIDNIYPNLSNEVSAAMVGTFCDNFIDSIYDYTDKKWGLLATFSDTSIGINGENWINFDANEMSINVNSEYLKINMLHSTDKKIESNARNIDFTNNIDIYTDNILKIGRKSSGKDTNLAFAGEDITFRTGFDNGSFEVQDSDDAYEPLFSISQGFISLKDGMFIRMGFDNGITGTFTYLDDWGDGRQFIIKGGIIVGEGPAV